MTTKVVTRGGLIRASYAHVFEAKAIESGGKEKYSICLLIPKTETELVTTFSKAIAAAVEEGKVKCFQGKVPANMKMPLRDGDVERDDDTYQGHYFINASSINAPLVLDAMKNVISIENGNTNLFYSGCYINVSVNFYPFSVNGNRGIACGLNGIQKMRDGQSLEGAGNAFADFDESPQESDFANDVLNG